MDICDTLEFTEEDVAGLENVSLDFLVNSFYDESNNKGSFQISKLPDSPPDSGSEHLFSPGCQQLSPSDNPGIMYDPRPKSSFPDLSSVDYNVPLQLIQEESNELYLNEGEAESSSGFRHIRHSVAGVRPSRGDDGSSVDIKKRKLEPKKERLMEVKVEPSEPVVELQSSSSMNNSLTIRFKPFYQDSWRPITDHLLNELPAPILTVNADKGFNYSNVDEAFIVQKKNHFQLTCIIQFPPVGELHYVNTPDGLKEIQSLQLNFYGIKFENPVSSPKIRIEQSLANRSKQRFDPIPVPLNSPTKEKKISVGRLHFSETTSNNMRKKGKPNPAQKYFQLAVSLEAIAMDENKKRFEVPLCSQASERIIVRASNPGQFESDPEVIWAKSENDSGTIYHAGKVSIASSYPAAGPGGEIAANEILNVHGNIQLTGSVLQPSDVRLKDKIREINSREQLMNVNKIKIVSFKYKDLAIPGKEQKGIHTGVIAQEVQGILPEAVYSSGNYVMENGKEIKDLLLVNKDRLFLENIGAVRELSKVTDNIERRIYDLEKANESIRLSRLKRSSSVVSSSSHSSSSSKDRRTRSHKFNKNIFSYRIVQIGILLLLLLSAFAIVAMASVYIAGRFQGDENSSDANGNSSVLYSNPLSFSNDIRNTSMTITTRKAKQQKWKNRPVAKRNKQGTLILGDSKNCSSHTCLSFCCGFPAKPNIYDKKISLNNTSIQENEVILDEKSDENRIHHRRNKDFNNEVLTNDTSEESDNEVPTDKPRTSGERTKRSMRYARRAELGERTRDIREGPFSLLRGLPVIIETESEGNYTLDNHFVDSHSDSTLNATVKLSKYFPDKELRIVFPFRARKCGAEKVVHCEPQADKALEKEDKISTVFSVDISLKMSLSYRFLFKDETKVEGEDQGTSLSSGDICREPHNSFYILNIKFVRLCV